MTRLHGASAALAALVVVAAVHGPRHPGPAVPIPGVAPDATSTVRLTSEAARNAGALRPPEEAARPGEAAAIDPDAVVARTCVRCHSDRRLRGNLSLETFEFAALPENADVGERMVRKLRAGMMPPPGARRPAGDTLVTLVQMLEDRLDEAAAEAPTPGSRSFQRLNRPEYERAIHELLGLHVNAEDWLPADQMSANFDNIADAQTLSPTLLEAYLNAAAAISRMAIGDPGAAPVNVAYRNAEYVSQHGWDHIEGAPWGTRGGMVVDHVFPADGEYTFQMTFAAGDNEFDEDIDIAIDGERVALVPYTQAGQGADGRGGIPLGTEPVFRTGRSASGVRSVRQERRWAVRGSDPPARVVAGGRRCGRSGDHHVAAPTRPGDRGTVQRDRRVRDTCP